jgi:flagellar biosynthetic protein FliR
MQSSLTITAGTLAAFLLVMARTGGMMLFLPMPGLRYGPALPRIVLALASAFLVFPQWPRTIPDAGSFAHFVGAMLGETGLGVAVGLCVASLAEALVMAAQLTSLQAGYSYASTIDPTTEAEAGYLIIVAQLLAGLLFFGLGLDRQVLLALARSLTSMPPGSIEFSRPTALLLTQITSSIFSSGIRLVLPLVALLAMTDIALALVGRLNSQLQVISLAFPVKMLASLGLLAWILALYPRLGGQLAEQSIAAVYRILIR